MNASFRRAALLLVVLAVLASPGIYAAPKGVESLHAPTWKAFGSGMKRPTVVVFATTDCAYCPAVIEQMAHPRRAAIARGPALRAGAGARHPLPALAPGR